MDNQSNASLGHLLTKERDRQIAKAKRQEKALADTRQAIAHLVKALEELEQ